MLLILQKEMMCETSSQNIGLLSAQACVCLKAVQGVPDYRKCAIKHVGGGSVLGMEYAWVWRHFGVGEDGRRAGQEQAGGQTRTRRWVDWSA